MRTLILSALTFVAVFGCSKKSDESSSGGSAASNIDLVLSSSTLSTLRDPGEVRTFAGSSCNVNTDAGGSESGLCYTPARIGGYFNLVSLGSTMGGAGVRLLGGGSLSGLEAVFHAAAFDLKTSPTIEGEDNIQDGTSASYNLVSLSVQAIEYTFTGTSSNKYYHVRIPFVATPPSSSSVFASCGLGGGLAEADTFGTLYQGITASAGDILVCIKSSSSETCANSDYQWVDGSGVQSATRPSSPQRLAGSYLMTADTCTQGASHPELNWGSAGLDILLSSSVSVTAAIDRGNKTYTVGSSSGSKLTVNLNIATTGSLFVPTSAMSGDLSAATETAILQNLSSIQIKPIYIKNRKTNAAPGTGDMTATATLSVSNE